MKTFDEMEYFEPAEKIVEVLCKKTQNDSPLFFRVLTAYYLTKVASMMRTDIVTHDRGNIPVSMYAMNLAVSGFGKNHSTNIIEDHLIKEFKDEFLENTFPLITEKSLVNLSSKRAVRKGTDPQDELLAVQKEFSELGTLLFSFDSGTAPALKQMRHILLMSGAGSINFEMDEMASNLLNNTDVFSTYLTLFDIGMVKQKLIKNTKDNSRNEEIIGRTPTNMLLFGTPTKLFDGGKIEEEFITMMDTGYARRCIFGFGELNHMFTTKDVNAIYDELTNNQLSTELILLSRKLRQLADMNNFGNQLTMTKDVSLLTIEYQQNCKKQAAGLADHEDILKAELTHRYFKALKLAGTYAFIDESPEITEEHYYNAVKLVEESGKAFSRILTRPRNYEKLARYIANIGREVTHIDLIEELPFYKGSENQRNEMLKLAVTYGYKNNIIIKKTYADDIEFLKGESLEETHLNELTLSYGTDITEGFKANYVSFDKIHKLTQANGYHFTAHHFIDGYRKAENAIPGFNLVILDVDEGVDMATAQYLMRDYTYHIYTTKRHTPERNRFRMILPISHHLKLNSKDYREFMNNVFEFLPFEVDEQTNDISRKWLSNQGHYEYNEGIILDALQFIPATKRNEERKSDMAKLKNLNNFERWFLKETDSGNRNNQLIRYALALVEDGKSIEDIRNSVLNLNNKLKDKIDENEIFSTIMVTVTKKVTQRDMQQGDVNE